MSPDTKKWLRFLQSWAINTLAVALAVEILRGHIQYDKFTDLLFASFLLGLLNAFVRPILLLLALPLLIFTLGLFTLVINALLLYFVSYLLRPHFQVSSFGYAFLGAVIISVVSVTLNLLTGGGGKVTVRRQRPTPPPDDKGGGPGSVIDV